MKSIYVLAALAIAGGVLITTAQSKSGVDTKQLSAAYRDGIYLGTLAARREEEPHIAVGRWATADDRELYTNGYTDGYKLTMAQELREKSNLQNTAAAYRDGMYLGKLDAEQGRAQRLAVGRWSELKDRNSFADGYRRAYAEIADSSAAKAERAQEASLVR